jgi:hypothetical protein
MPWIIREFALVDKLLLQLDGMKTGLLKAVYGRRWVY